MSWDEIAEKLGRFSQRMPNGCLEWSRGCDQDGYGIVTLQSRTRRAHRMAWAVRHKRHPPQGMVVRHKCDNPPCIDADHLLLGTVAQNNGDRQRRGRSADRRGDLCPTAKLTWETVAEIRSLLADGRTHSSLAVQHGVSRKAISKIAHGLTWRCAA